MEDVEGYLRERVRMLEAAVKRLEGVIEELQKSNRERLYFGNWKEFHSIEPSSIEARLITHEAKKQGGKK